MSKTQNTTPDRNTEEAILQAAKRVFTRKGFAAARMEDIATEAGINRALLHYYFRSKEKMFERVFEENMSHFYGSFISILNAPAPLDMRIRNLVNAEIDMLLANPDVPLFILTEISRNPDMIKSKMEKMPVREFMMIFVSSLRTEMQKGTIRQIEPVHVLMSLMSLCIFPFIGKPMFLTVSGMPPEQFESLMQSRKKVVADIILQMLKPEQA
ncbi:MAG TPA: TetR/AcrR family transcriptional regulator [Chitinophagales bacterium]|nr:TetR/AcrR family transcriptional regulator [Chitinophagales bacterium]HMX05679.1 TetR/AcrR family transcriptional regulator [Chitinophagales bacterium]HMZ88858.1 TetR/AcrR family transcriptional regulator [Chitinophagales bacterium]HNA58786.1 TetR/AcrR family transcriptional regulator [Chitinophagales bacterium]HNE46059.1 TetR/AcrR family transcriptional regulator [Chitinophagales bacterium]